MRGSTIICARKKFKPHLVFFGVSSCRVEKVKWESVKLNRNQMMHSIILNGLNYMNRYMYTMHAFLNNFLTILI